MKFKFYVVGVVAILALLVNVIAQYSIVQGREDNARLGDFETLSYWQCAERYQAVIKELETRPNTVKEYFRVLGRAYGIIGSSKKAMLHPPVTWSDRTGPDYQLDSIVRGISINIDSRLNQYANYLAPFVDTPEFEVAKHEFEISGVDPTRPRNVFVAGAERLSFWWLLFHVGAMPFVIIHFCIQLRERGNKIFHDMFGNPMFPFWVLFWEIGLFRYPMKVSPTEQLIRARRWATLVLSSAISCFAGTGKVCEEKREQAPQHQKYDGLWSRFAFSTTTLSNYIGQDGAVFFEAPVQQSNVTAALPCKMYVNFFHSEPFGDRSLRPNFGREMDYTLGWARTFGGYAIDANVTYVNVFPLTALPRGDVLEFNERVTKKISFGKQNAVAPYLWLVQAFPTRGATPAGGNLIHWGATFSHAFNDHVSASVTADAVHDSGALGFNEGFIGRLIGGIDWKRKRGITLQFPQIIFVDPISHTGDGRHPAFSFGLGLVFSPVH